MLDDSLLLTAETGITENALEKFEGGAGHPPMLTNGDNALD
jgi:hypothetical protein